MVIMVFKNINQIQKKENKIKLYTYWFGLLSLLHSIFLQIWNRDRNPGILKLRTNHTESIRKSTKLDFWSNLVD